MYVYPTQMYILISDKRGSQIDPEHERLLARLLFYAHPLLGHCIKNVTDSTQPINHAQTPPASSTNNQKHVLLSMQVLPLESKYWPSLNTICSRLKNRTNSDRNQLLVAVDKMEVSFKSSVNWNQNQEPDSSHLLQVSLCLQSLPFYHHKLHYLQSGLDYWVLKAQEPEDLD